MATKLQALGYAVHVRGTGQILIVGRDADLIQPNDCFVMADGGEIPAEVAEQIPHRPEGFSASRKVHRLEHPTQANPYAPPAAVVGAAAVLTPEERQVLEHGKKAERQEVLARLLGEA